MPNPAETYISTCEGVETLIASDQIGSARIILTSYLTNDSTLDDVCDFVFDPSDADRDEFRLLAPQALRLLDSQLEDAAAALCRAARILLNEAQIS